MPKYFFDIKDGQQFRPDADGQEMDNLQSAQREAIASLHDLARMTTQRDDEKTITASLRDVSGDVVLRATLSVTVERPEPGRRLAGEMNRMAHTHL